MVAFTNFLKKEETKSALATFANILSQEEAALLKKREEEAKKKSNSASSRNLSGEKPNPYSYTNSEFKTDLEFIKIEDNFSTKKNEYLLRAFRLGWYLCGKGTTTSHIGKELIKLVLDNGFNLISIQNIRDVKFIGFINHIKNIFSSKQLATNDLKQFEDTSNNLLSKYGLTLSSLAEMINTSVDLKNDTTFAPYQRGFVDTVKNSPEILGYLYRSEFFKTDPQKTQYPSLLKELIAILNDTAVKDVPPPPRVQAQGFHNKDTSEPLDIPTRGSILPADDHRKNAKTEKLAAQANICQSITILLLACEQADVELDKKLIKSLAKYKEGITQAVINYVKELSTPQTKLDFINNKILKQVDPNARSPIQQVLYQDRSLLGKLSFIKARESAGQLKLVRDYKDQIEKEIKNSKPETHPTVTTASMAQP